MIGIIKYNGTIVSKLIFDDINKIFFDNYRNQKLYYNDLALVNINSKYGYIDRTGNLQIFCKYDDATVFKERDDAKNENDPISNNLSLKMACVKKNGKWGIIDDKGKYIVENKFDSIIQINNNSKLWFAHVIFQNKSILINNSGKKIIDFPFQKIEPFQSGMAAVLDSNNYWGFLDTTLNLKIECKYGFIPDNCISSWQYPPKFIGHNCLVTIEKEENGPLETYGIINYLGKNVVPWSTCFLDIPQYENYYAQICTPSGKFGLIDYKLNTIIPLIYDELLLSFFQPFDLYGECSSEHYYIESRNLIPARKSDKWGFIDRNGIIMIPFIYESVKYFDQNLVKAIYNGEEISINIRG